MDPSVVRCTRTNGTSFDCRIQKVSDYKFQAWAPPGAWPLHVDTVSVDHVPRHATIELIFRLQPD